MSWRRVEGTECVYCTTHQEYELTEMLCPQAAFSLMSGHAEVTDVGRWEGIPFGEQRPGLQLYVHNRNGTAQWTETPPGANQ